jgi:hypothetical protein
VNISLIFQFVLCEMSVYATRVARFLQNAAERVTILALVHSGVIFSADAAQELSCNQCSLGEELI